MIPLIDGVENEIVKTDPLAELTVFFQSCNSLIDIGGLVVKLKLQPCNGVDFALYTMLENAVVMLIS